MEEIRLDNVRRVLDEYAIRFQEYLKVQLQKNDKVATGNLIASINTTIEVDGCVYTVYLNSLKYLEYIELGQRPHWIPSGKLLTWIRAKQLPTRELTGNKSLPTEKQLDYLIRRKISIDGVKPVPVIEETIKEINEVYIKRLEDALATDIYNAIPIIKVSLRFLA